MNIYSINRRLDQLDVQHPVETPRRFIRLIVAADEGETQDQAIARWCAENPDEAAPGDGDVIILRSIVSPKRRPDEEPLQ